MANSPRLFKHSKYLPECPKSPVTIHADIQHQSSSIHRNFKSIFLSLITVVISHCQQQSIRLESSEPNCDIIGLYIGLSVCNHHHVAIAGEVKSCSV